MADRVGVSLERHKSLILRGSFGPVEMRSVPLFRTCLKPLELLFVKGGGICTSCSLTLSSRSPDSFLKMATDVETQIGGQGSTPSGYGPKSVLRWAVGIIASVALALWTVVKWNDWRQFQADLISYKGVAIGQTKTEVQYAVGAPQTVQGPEVDASDGWTTSSPLRVDLYEENTAIPEGYDPLPKGQTAMDYDDWHYWSNEGTFDVTFDAKSGRVESISCWQPHDSPGPCATIFGVGQFTSEDAVVRALGAPDKEEVSGGEMLMGMPVQVSKSMDYNALGLHLVLTKREVDRVTKRAPQGAGLTWWLRHRLF